MDDKLYSIANIAQELQLSKAYIYKVYNKYKKELKPYKQTVKSVTYLNTEGFNYIKDKLNPKEDENIKKIAIELDPHQQLIATLQDEIKYLRGQLQEKENQVKSKDGLIEKHIEMIQEQTELVKREQQLRMTESQNILLLQQHIGEVDEKLTAWRESAATKEEKVSFFKKIFK